LIVVLIEAVATDRRSADQEGQQASADDEKECKAHVQLSMNGERPLIA
jgi:hypothetical protein